MAELSLRVWWITFLIIFSVTREYSSVENFDLCMLPSDSEGKRQFTIRFSIDDTFPNQLLNPNSNIFQLYRKRVEETLTVAPYQGKANHTSSLDSIRFSPGSIQVTAVINVEEETTTESIFENVEVSIYQEFDIVTDTLEVSTSSTVRLSNGDFGYIEILHDAVWGTVCDDTFDLNNRGCTVVCRQLGFTYGIYEQLDQFGQDPIWLDNVLCTGTEARLEECAHDEWGVHDCQHSENAGCRCCDNNEECSLEDSGDVELRLSNGASGILEVNYNGLWGTVCDDVFDTDNNGCNVVCRMLNYSGGEFERHGSGTGPILLDDVRCTGSEETLSQCSHTGWGNHNCDHSEDVGCTCATDSEMGGESACIPDTGHHEAVWLSNGHYGIIHVYYNGAWGTVCDDIFDNNNIGCMVVCTQIGFSTGVFESFGAGTGDIWLDNVMCSGSETHLDECVHNGFGIHNCGHVEDAGCRCIDDHHPASEPSEDPIDVRLSNEYFGTLEVLHDGEWGTVCDDSFDQNDHGCMVVCRQLGFSYGVYQQHFPGTGTILLDNVRCTGTEDNIASCRHAGLGVHNCDHSEDAGCKCCDVQQECADSECGIQESDECMDMFYESTIGNVNLCINPEIYKNELVECLMSTTIDCDEAIRNVSLFQLLNFIEEELSYICPDIASGSGGSFTCDDGRAISPEWVCDDYVDCSNGEDEQQCGDGDGECSDGPFGETGPSSFDITTDEDTYINGFYICINSDSGLLTGMNVYFNNDHVDDSVGCNELDSNNRITLGSDELINEVVVYIQSGTDSGAASVQGILFATNTGSEFGPYGGSESASIAVAGSKLIGIFGTQGATGLATVGFYWECLTQSEENSLYCDFETIPEESCLNENVQANFYWTRQNDSTNSLETGPYQAYSNDWYLYIEASSPRIAGESARFKTKTLALSDEACLSFWLSMYGRDTGFLTVHMVTKYSMSADSPETRRVIYKEGGYSIKPFEDISSFWSGRYIPLTFDTSQFVYFEFEANTGTGSRGDIAIDKLSVDNNMDLCDTNRDCIEFENPVGLICMDNYPSFTRSLPQLFYQAGCVLEGLANPLHNISTREYYSSLSTYSVWNMMEGIFRDSALGYEVATKECYGDFAINRRAGIRLMSGDDETTASGFGRVEVKMNDNWRSICDDGFDSRSATVVCRHLGHSGGEVRSGAFYGHSNTSFRVFFNSVRCQGDESYLYQCTLEQNLYDVCPHANDVGVICIVENSGALSYIGPNETTALSFTNLDDTINSIFIPNVEAKMESNGNLTQWTVSFITDVVDVYLQVWREVGVDIFELVGQNQIRTSDLGNAERDAENSTYAFLVSESEAIHVQSGDVLGFYYPEEIAIPFKATTCYTAEEQLRYVYKPAQPPDIGEKLSFGIAPLSWDPCRTYMLQARIEKNNNHETEEETDEDLPKPPLNSPLFESFEEPVKSSMRCTGWTRHSGPTPSIGTGPFSAARGRYYMHTEASVAQPEQQFTCESDKINLKGSVCISFFYHMYGPNIGRLQVLMLDAESESIESGGPIEGVILDRRRSQYHEWLWHSSEKQFSFSSGKLRFTATMGNGFQGDIAIDNVLVSKGKCSSAEDLTGQPIINSTREEATGEHSVFEEVFLENSVSYIGHGSSGSMNDTACSKDYPCLSLEAAMELESKNKTIIFDDRLHVTYSMDISEVPDAIKHLNLTVLLIDGGTPFIGSGPTLHLSGRRCFQSLAFSHVYVTGEIHIDCDDETETTLILSNVAVQMPNGITVMNAKTLTVDIENTTFESSLVRLSAKDRSNINIKSSSFQQRVSQPSEDDVTASPSRKKRDSHNTDMDEHDHEVIGLFIEYATANSIHRIRVSNCTFAGMHQHKDNLNPSGAFSIVNSELDSILYINIENSKFEHNERALDFSVKGDIDIAVTNCVFYHNYADGSGGAIRITSHLEVGLGAIPNVKKGKVCIEDCTFSHNIAQTSAVYSPDDIYYQSRSPGSGGAVFVSIVVPSQLLKDGLITITNSTFMNNTAEVQGGSLFVNPEISLEILFSKFTNSYLSWRPKFGDILFASSNMTIRDTNMVVVRTDRTTPIVSYRATDTANYRLILDNFKFECPVGHWIEQLNTTSFSPLEGSGIGALQVYCRGCEENEYSLNISRAVFSNATAILDNAVICTECPYGAECNGGILNTDGFWGIQQNVEGSVKMYQCPEEYCSKKNDEHVYFNGCAPHRLGTLCGHCASGYSESLFGTKCVRNEDCGMQNWWVVIFFIVYGVLYVFFFMFQGDWEHFISWVSKKLKRKRKGGDNENKTNLSSTSDERLVNDSNKTDTDNHKSPPGNLTDDNDNADMGKSGYFPIFMYFIQTASLLKVNIVVVEDEIYSEVYRPQDILPSFLIDGIQEMFSFNMKFLEGKTCLFESLNVVSKTWIKLALVGSLFAFVILLYIFSAGCCVCFPVNRRPRIGLITNTVRILITVMSLFLYTYQSVAEDAFLLLNCVTVEGDQVLFYDGSVSCLQDWQYAIIALVTVFVIPFFIVLLFGPKLLEQKRVGIILFMFSCIFPLFMSVPICWMYFKLYKELKAKQSTSNREHDLDDEAEESNFCCGDVNEIRDEIVDLLSGPYRNDIFGGVCYEGILNFRRMVMVVMFTFLTDILLRQMALAFVCFVILLMHQRAKPFRQTYSNYVETVALSLLLIMGCTNMVKAAFYHSQTVPRGTNYLVIVIYEWIEAICIGILPLVIITAILVALIVETGSKAVSKGYDNKSKIYWSQNNYNGHSLRERRSNYDQGNFRFHGEHHGGLSNAMRFPSFDHYQKHSLNNTSDSNSGRDHYLLRNDYSYFRPLSRNVNRIVKSEYREENDHKTHQLRAYGNDPTSIDRTESNYLRHSTKHQATHQKRLPRTDGYSLAPLEGSGRNGNSSRLSSNKRPKHLRRTNMDSFA